MEHILAPLLGSLDWHWMRPHWLFGLVPAALLATGLLYRRRAGQARWTEVIDPALLPALLQGDNQRPPRSPAWWLLSGWVLAVLALAGPSWDKTSTAALKRADAVIILLDLSPSMLVEDVKPSRLEAAQYKVLDLLRQRKEGYTALIAYSGSAHVVAPLSDDANTIAALVPTLEPGIMPQLGSRPEDAVQEGLALLHNAHFPRGRLLLVTDGVDEAALPALARQLAGQPVTLDIIGVGTETGGPVPLAKGGFVTDDEGKPRLFGLLRGPLQDLASRYGGRYSDLQLDDSDIAPLVGLPGWMLQDGNQAGSRPEDQQLEHWQDSGFWLLFPLLLLCLLAFRRGAVATWLLPCCLLLGGQDGQALDWESLWRTPDQQGARLLPADPAAAAERFEDPQWKAYAEYQAGQHAQAAEHLAGIDTAQALYNRGNALAQAGQLDEAIASYQAALEKQPDFESARFNHDLVKKLLQQQQQKQQGEQSEQQQDPNQQDGQGQQQGEPQQSAGQPGPPQEGAPQPSQPSQQGSEPQSSPGDPASAQNGASGNPQDSPPDSQTGSDPLQQDPAKMNSAQDAAQDASAPTSPAQAAGEPEAQPDQASENGEQAASRAEGAPATPGDGEEASASDQAATLAQESPQEREKRIATEQWLRKVPDDPGGLLRNKFEYYYRQHRRQQMQQAAPVDEQRW